MFRQNAIVKCIFLSRDLKSNMHIYGAAAGPSFVELQS